MTDEVKAEVIKKTQEVLGKFIKKPTLTEKLLKKPPFRFLHDICTSVTKETGFFEQVLGPEDKIENIKDKEGKIAFLQKVIAAVEAASGVKLTVKPNKVVAGLEATKTNEFLQALGKALEKRQLERKGSKTNVNTKSKTTTKTEKEIKEEPPDKKKSSKTTKKTQENGTTEDNKAKSTTSPKKKHSNKILEPTTSYGVDKIEGNQENISNGYPEKEEETTKEDVAQKSAHGRGESKDLTDVNIIRVNGTDGQGDQNPMTKEEIPVNVSEHREGHSGKSKQRRSSMHSNYETTKNEETLESNETSGASGSVSFNDNFKMANKSELQNKSPSSSGQTNFSKKEGSAVKEGSIISRPRTGIRPTTARPTSARPAAPRIRDRGDIAVTEEILKPASGKVQVIVDEDTVNEAEDENLISLETSNDVAMEESTEIIQQENTTHEHEHGHLVEQILEVQRELEDDLKFSEQKETGKTEIEWESDRNKESKTREIEKLRANIQNLTRTVNPLGKLLDFFQEDIDIIQKELESWRQKNRSYRLQIAQEQSITEQFVEPLKIHLKELQKSIDEQMEQINVVKANIIRNNEKIHKLLSGF